MSVLEKVVLQSFSFVMAEVPKPSTPIDHVVDGDGLVRLAHSPTSTTRPKRPTSLPHSLSVSEAVPTAEELLTQTLLDIEGDEVSYDVFQLVIEMVCSLKRTSQIVWILFSFLKPFIQSFMP